MPKRCAPEMVEDAFCLYLKYNGERFDLIEKEMRQRGWTTFNKNCLTTRGVGKNFREGWIERFGWKAALEDYWRRKAKDFLSGEEKLLAEVEIVREKIFDQIQTHGVNNRDLVYQHDKYLQKSEELLQKIENAKNHTKDFAGFLNWLLQFSLQNAPTLARELCNYEDAIIRHAKDELAKG